MAELPSVRLMDAVLVALNPVSSRKWEGWNAEWPEAVAGEPRIDDLLISNCEKFTCKIVGRMHVMSPLGPAMLLNVQSVHGIAIKPLERNTDDSCTQEESS